MFVQNFHATIGGLFIIPALLSSNIAAAPLGDLASILSEIVALNVPNAVPNAPRMVYDAYATSVPEAKPEREMFVDIRKMSNERCFVSSYPFTHCETNDDNSCSLRVNTGQHKIFMRTKRLKSNSTTQSTTG
jgi:hypothetical protein